jgi:hypothetical protein
VPDGSDVLEYVHMQAAPFSGQGFAVDPAAGRLVGINGPNGRLVIALTD